RVSTVGDGGCDSGAHICDEMKASAGSWRKSVWKGVVVAASVGSSARSSLGSKGDAAGPASEKANDRSAPADDEKSLRTGPSASPAASGATLAVSATEVDATES